MILNYEYEELSPQQAAAEIIRWCGQHWKDLLELDEDTMFKHGGIITTAKGDGRRIIYWLKKAETVVVFKTARGRTLATVAADNTLTLPNP